MTCMRSRETKLDLFRAKILIRAYLRSMKDQLHEVVKCLNATLATVQMEYSAQSIWRSLPWKNSTGYRKKAEDDLPEGHLSCESKCPSSPHNESQMQEMT